VFIKGVLVGNTNILFSLGTRWRSQVKKIDGTYGRILMEWDGDKEKIRGIESMVNNLFPATA